MNKILLNNATIADPGGPNNGKKANILIEDGTVKKIGSEKYEADVVIDASGCHVSQGWTDALAFCGEPGEEWKESLASLASTAQAGGFTAVAAFCGTHPIPDTASAIASIVERTKQFPVQILPLGAITSGAEGKDMAEIFDMKNAGAVGFFDGDHALNHNGLQSRVMEYAANCKAPLLLFPFDKNLAMGGSMHEGVESTRLGLKGMPSISEVSALQADIEMATWLKTPLRLVRISCAESLELIRNAKAKGLEIYAAVPVMNLLFTDKELSEFDENYKVLPPLRTAQDREALLKGILDGTIDAVCSNHVPQDAESKDVEFDYAAYGASTIQTVLNILLQALGNKANPEMIARVLAQGPRTLLGLPNVAIAEGSNANFTVFSMEKEWNFNHLTNLSKSKNNCMLGTSFKGMCIGTIKDGIWYENGIHAKKTNA